MLHDLVEKITDAETLQAYNRAVKELADSLRAAGEPDKAQKLTEIAELRNNGGISYDSFETALKYYKENGIVEGDTSDVKEFNDLMAFVYIGRKEAEEQIASLDESQYIINSITWVLPPEQA